MIILKAPDFAPTAELLSVLVKDGLVSFTKTLAAPFPALKKGTLFAGKYRISGEIGRGGMGVVFKAKDTKLKRPVALKLLPLELSLVPDAKERFLREAQAAAALDHPNICTVYEVDEQDGQAFIAMAYIEGESLKEKIAQGSLKIEEVLDIAVQVAEGLEEAHRKGVIHRDIKPANIMLTPKGQARIMDFGLARLESAGDLTRTDVVMGTVAYMSPEQASELDRSGPATGPATATHPATLYSCELNHRI